MTADNDVFLNTYELAPPAKRRRMSSTPRTSSTLAVDLDKTEDLFWFQDGDIVLGVDCKYFKVHRNKMVYSLVFATMLELPQPELVERAEGCPLVRLHGDTIHDWTAALHWMYDRSSFELRSTTFNIIAGALRISTKYDIPELRLWCKQQLLSRWPLNVADMNTSAIPNAAEAICLARELDVPEILPAAFYALSVQRWAKGIDGGRSHLILSPEDLRRLIVGREELQERLTGLLTNWDERTDAAFFRLCRMCQPLCIAWLSYNILPSSLSPYSTWLLRDLRQLSLHDSNGLHLCTGCANDFRCTIDDFIGYLQAAIPKYFMLSG
ncbi:hypothetical protein BU15DRAFT_51921 [Melanogaster broomeanus]|nr:hypothetical protein BU15DRAFT_51921 [Melanogaster broomeanus]